MADEKMVRVRTGESSYIEFNEADAAEWRKTHDEYGAAKKPAAADEDKKPTKADKAES